MKRLIGIGLAALAALLPAPFPAAAQPAQLPPLAERLREACRAVREVDRSRLPAQRDMSGIGYHREMRSAAAAPPAGHRGPLIRLFRQQSVPGPFPSLSVIAWKRPDGRWFVSRLSDDPPGGMSGMPLMWPHEPGIDTSELPVSYWSQGEGVLGEAESRELEQILASRCLTREPPVRPANLPLRGGGERLCMWHPTFFHLEIGGGGSPARSYTRSCRVYRDGSGTGELLWASDLLADLLARAALAAPPAGPRREVPAIPERFHGRWAQGAENCGDTTLMRAEIGADSFDVGGGPNRVRSVDVRGDRTVVVNATGPAFFQGLEPIEFALPLLLSADGERMAVPQMGGGWLLQLARCPAG